MTVEAPYEKVAYPAAPWRMKGQLWMSMLKLSEDVTTAAGVKRPAGMYMPAFISYEEGPLTYSELLVARSVKGPGLIPRVSITDIWVDSPASVAGGRELWAIPKGLCDFDLDSEHRGLLTRTRWSASFGSEPIASARFADVGKLAPPAPFKGYTDQPELPEGGGHKLTMLSGTARPLPCRGTWDFAADGPLGWLRGAKQVTSIRGTNFAMSFGA